MSLSKEMGTVVYNGTTDYQGNILVNNANFKVNGLIDEASIFVCRNIGFSQQRGTLSGAGTLTGNVFVNSGTIAPDAGETLTLGGLSLNPADLPNDTLGSLVQIAIDSTGTSLVSVTGPASLAGTLEIALDPDAQPGAYTILTSSAITGTFETVEFTGATATPIYSINYLPVSADVCGVRIHRLRTAPDSGPAILAGQRRFRHAADRFDSPDLRDVEQRREWRSHPERLQHHGGAFTATNDCPATLAPNASCTVQITFSPDAVGNYSGVLSLDSDAPGAPATVTLSGTGASGHRASHGHRRRWRGNHIACGRHGRRRPNANIHRDACRRLQHLEREWLRRKFERQHLHDCADFGKLLHYRRIRGGGDGARQGRGRVHGLPHLGWLADHVALAVFPPPLSRRRRVASRAALHGSGR